MHIIAHRGEWTNPAKNAAPNSLEAFRLALQNGFGIEVDIRDRDNQLVISHNPAEKDCPCLRDLLEGVSGRPTPPIAFNVKSDGLQPLLCDMLEKHRIKNYFTFDMSVPNTLADAQFKLNFFLRQSDLEPYPRQLEELYLQCKGIWMDQFRFSPQTLRRNLRSVPQYIEEGKHVCWVSPELHPWGREDKRYLEIWGEFKRVLSDTDASRVSLCTDYPAQAKEYFL